MDFKERFGLDFIVGSRSDTKSNKTDDLLLPKGLRDAVLAYGGKIMGTLNSKPEKSMRLFDLAEATATRVDTLLPVTKALVDAGYLERVSEDPVGNDTFRLTDPGSKIAQ